MTHMGVIYLIQILRLEGYFEGQGLGLAKGGGGIPFIPVTVDILLLSYSVNQLWPDKLWTCRVGPSFFSSCGKLWERWSGWTSWREGRHLQGLFLVLVEYLKMTLLNALRAPDTRDKNKICFQFIFSSEDMDSPQPLFPSSTSDARWEEYFSIDH